MPLLLKSLLTPSSFSPPFSKKLVNSFTTLNSIIVHHYSAKPCKVIPVNVKFPLPRVIGIKLNEILAVLRRQESSKTERLLNNSTPDSSALGGQMHQATERKRHQEGNKTGAKQPGRTRDT